ncbi:MAG: S46 family peptidase, partial [Candidatus Eremiobacteraeota bacterium]|nr:S46 family peptidase [Candidatus Eremiobacteraeota bacterium]
MWTFNEFPSAKVGKLYGFAPSPKWLDHVRSSSVRIAGGCSSSFISRQGLVMTNHHCAVDCVDQLSTQKQNFVETGFYAKALSNEVKCPDFELNALTGIENVTAEVQNATRGLSGERYSAAVRAENAKLQKECATSPGIRCDVVSLYHGGIYNLYKYKRHRDVRLVF